MGRYSDSNFCAQWACTLIAFLALICAPIPFVFYKYGKTIRGWSKYAPSDEEVREMMARAAAAQQKPADVEAPAPAPSTTDDLERSRSQTDRHLDNVIGKPVEGEEQPVNYA